MKSFLKKNWSTLLILAFFALLMIPPTGMPIKVFVQRIIMMAPSELPLEERRSILVYDWMLRTPEGRTINFNDSDGKVSLVNFWATWCPPCVAELPSMQKLYEVYGDRIDFYFVTSEDPETIQRFIKKKGYAIPVYIEQHAPPKSLRVSTIPTTFVISSEGEIIIQKTGAAQWDSEKVRLLLDTLINTGTNN